MTSRDFEVAQGEAANALSDKEIAHPLGLVELKTPLGPLLDRNNSSSLSIDHIIENKELSSCKKFSEIIRLGLENSSSRPEELVEVLIHDELCDSREKGLTFLKIKQPPASELTAWRICELLQLDWDQVEPIYKAARVESLDRLAKARAARGTGSEDTSTTTLDISLFTEQSNLSPLEHYKGIIQFALEQSNITVDLLSSTLSQEGWYDTLEGAKGLFRTKLPPKSKEIAQRMSELLGLEWAQFEPIYQSAREEHLEQLRAVRAVRVSKHPGSDSSPGRRPSETRSPLLPELSTEASLTRMHLVDRLNTINGAQKTELLTFLSDHLEHLNELAGAERTALVTPSSTPSHFARIVELLFRQRGKQGERVIQAFENLVVFLDSSQK